MQQPPHVYKSKLKAAAVSTIISKPPFQAKKKVAGRVIVIQEERFKLKTDAGDVLLLRLSRSANVDPLELCGFHENDEHVEVEYVGDSNLTNAVARKVRPA